MAAQITCRARSVWCRSASRVRKRAKLASARARHCASTSAEIGFSLDLFTKLEIEANSSVFVEHEKIRPCSRYGTIS